MALADRPKHPFPMVSRVLTVAIVLVVVAIVAWPRGSTPLAGTRSYRYGAETHVVDVSSRLVAFGHIPGWNPAVLLQTAPRLYVRLDERAPEHAAAVLEVAAGAMTAALADLAARAEVTYAHPLLFQGDAQNPGSRHILTDEFVVRFAAGTPEAVIQSAFATEQAVVVRSFDWLTNAYLLRVPKSSDALDAANRLAARADVLFAHPNWLRKLLPREVVPNDPQFGNQWNLKNTGQGGGTAGADLKATYAWSLATGVGKTIAIIDTGVATGLSDIQQTVLGYNPITGAGVGAGADIATHGTGCAGVAAAAGNNGVLVSGVAPGATIMPIRLLTGSGYGTPVEESDCFNHATNNGADVISNSWGPDGVPFTLPTLVNAAFAYATTNGRAGKGCVIFWAAGNGNEDIVTDQYASSTYTIAVGATTNYDVRAVYSDYGAALDFVAPSSGGSRNINTTTPSNSYTSNFGGTSASAPEGAGIAALILQLNPNLTWTDVRTMMRQTCEKIQPTVAAYDSVGHSTTYGYGRLNAYNAAIAALASAGAPIMLNATTTGIGDITILLSNLDPNAQFLLGVSQLMYTPVGTGPFMGVGFDAMQTMIAPLGTIPLHSTANANGAFYWSSIGVPSGFFCQMVAVELAPAGGIRRSNIVSLYF